MLLICTIMYLEFSFDLWYNKNVISVTYIPNNEKYPCNIVILKFQTKKIDLICIHCSTCLNSFRVNGF